MDYSKTAGVAAMAIVPAIVLCWLMNMNLVGWLGAWFASGGGAWLVGALLVAAFSFGFAALWVGVVGKQSGLKKLPLPLTGLIFGAVVGLICATLVPLLLSAIAGNPGMSQAGFGDVIVSAFGVHIVPALPDLGFDPPLKSMARDEWVSRDAHGARLLPFVVAFSSFGLTLALFDKRGR